MDTLSNLALGFEAVLTPAALFYCFVGVTFGTFVGVLPGVGALIAIALLLPVTYYMDPLIALIMIAGIYHGGGYGGSIPAILLNLPGKASAAVTCLDGYPLAQQGRAGMALIGTASTAFVGATLGMMCLILFSPVIAKFALRFGPTEFFSLVTLGLVAAASISTGSTLKSIAMVLFGLMLGIVGTDINTAVPRFNFDIMELRDKLSLVAVAMGLFGIAEVVRNINNEAPRVPVDRMSYRTMWPKWHEIKQCILPILRGSSIGGFVGALPGTGMDVASFLAYATEVKVAKDPSRFGKGALEGLMSSEAAINAAGQTSFIPTLTLGIPGDAVMALVLGAMMIQGIDPGPTLITDQPVLFWGVAASFIVGNIMLLVLNIPLVGIWIRMLMVPYGIIYPFVIVFLCFGVFTVNNSTFDVLLVAIFGLVGYGMKVLDFPSAPVLLGLILGPMLEENLRRALVISHGDFSVFITSPISAVLLATSVALLVWSFWKSFKTAQREVAADQKAGAS